MWHWLTGHLSLLVSWMIVHMPYFYELLSGVLQFISSAITEEVMPKSKRKMVALDHIRDIVARIRRSWYGGSLWRNSAEREG
jgi:hypothetical protein